MLGRPFDRRARGATARPALGKARCYARADARLSFCARPWSLLSLPLPHWRATANRAGSNPAPLAPAQLPSTSRAQEDPAADQWLSLLSEICRQHPAAMIDSIQLVHAKLGELGRLPFGRAVGLLHALWPLHRLRPSFRDQLLASLRRAWATGSVETRALACRALMWLVVEELATPCEGGDESQGSKATQSQRPLGTMSQRSTLGSIPIPGVSLLHEMLAILRRAAVDEPEVSRAALRALPDVLEADATATVRLHGRQTALGAATRRQTRPPARALPLVPLPPLHRLFFLFGPSWGRVRSSTIHLAARRVRRPFVSRRPPFACRNRSPSGSFSR